MLQTSVLKKYISRRFKIELFLKERMYLKTKQNGTETEVSGCQISKQQDQSSPTEHSHIIP